MLFRSGHCLSPYEKLLAGLPDVTLVALISANNIIKYCKFSLGEPFWSMLYTQKLFSVYYGFHGYFCGNIGLL